MTDWYEKGRNSMGRTKMQKERKWGKKQKGGEMWRYFSTHI